MILTKNVAKRFLIIKFIEKKYFAMFFLAILIKNVAKRFLITNLMKKHFVTFF
jgi:hypothetical protein